MNASSVMMPKTLPLRDKFRRLIEYSVPAEEEGTLRGSLAHVGRIKLPARLTVITPTEVEKGCTLGKCMYGFMQSNEKTVFIL